MNKKNSTVYSQVKVRIFVDLHYEQYKLAFTALVVLQLKSTSKASKFCLTVHKFSNYFVLKLLIFLNFDLIM